MALTVRKRMWWLSAIDTGGQSRCSFAHFVHHCFAGQPQLNVRVVRALAPCSELGCQSSELEHVGQAAGSFPPVPVANADSAP